MKRILQNQVYVTVIQNQLAPVCIIACLLFFTSCKKEITIDLKDNEPQLIVEAYINNLLPEYNYVILTRSIDYFAPEIQGIGVSNAQIAITEGELLPDNTYSWNNSSRMNLEESDNARIPAEYRKGLYVDQKTVTVLSTGGTGFTAEPGKHYLLEISWEGKNYAAITSLPSLVEIDSLSSGFRYTDQTDSNKIKSAVTVHFKDPDTLGNRQLYYWRQTKNRDSFGWGALNTNRRINGADDLINGQPVNMTHPYGFTSGERVDYYLVSVTRSVYDFWESFSNARNNDGPFATPIKLISNIRGPNVTGCFSGFTVSTRSIVIP